ECTSGVAAGGRSGLTSLLVAGLLLITLFFAPIFEATSDLPAMTAPAFVCVGSWMSSGLGRIKWQQSGAAFPTSPAILSMPLTSSIATGIAVGFITYPLLKLVSGKGKAVHPIVYVFGVIFVLQMIYFPGH